MPQVTQRKNRDAHGVGFDTLETLQFAPVALALSQTNATVQASIVLPTTYKIYRVTALMTGTVASTCSINLVAGAAAEGTTGTPDTRDNGANAFPIAVAPAGTIVLAADTAITMTANTITQIDLPADLFDVVFKGQLTLRTVTSGSSTGTLTVSVLAKNTDINPPQGSYGSITVGSVTGQGGFAPATAIP